MHNAQIIFDPSYLTIDIIKECDWKHFYGNVHEAIPPNTPPPRGKDVNQQMFVDSDHASKSPDVMMLAHRLSDLFEYGPNYMAFKEASNNRDQHIWC
jgi:hypothetical protein